MSTFQGKYVEDMLMMLRASAVSHQHCIFMSPPGTGKTMIARAAADRIYGDQQVFIRLDASTPPEVVRGMPDPIAALQEGKYVLVREGTAYDPKAKVIIADELWRAMDPIYDVFLDVMDRQDIHQDESPIVWATSNFVSTSERTEAVRDRISLWQHIPDEPIEVQSTVTAQLLAEHGRLSVENNLPSLDAILDVYQATPGPNAIRAVGMAIERLKSEAEKGSGDKKISFKVNRRRIWQWGRILFRMGFYITHDPDFTSLPSEAVAPLRFAWPCLSMDESKAWQSVVQAAVVDPVSSAIQEQLKKAYKAFGEDTGRPLAERSIKLGMTLASMQDELRKLGKALATRKDIDGNPVVAEEVESKIKDAIASLQGAFAKAVKGENPMDKEVTMFGFLNMLGNHEDRKVATYESEDGSIFVDTCYVTDSAHDYETAVAHPYYNNDKIIIVAVYDDLFSAQAGHAFWLKTMTSPELPETIEDVSTADLAELLDTIDNGWRTFHKTVRFLTNGGDESDRKEDV